MGVPLEPGGEGAGPDCGKVILPPAGATATTFKGDVHMCG